MTALGLNMTDREPVTGWEAIQPSITHRQALRMISPAFNNAERAAEQGWKIYNAACDGNPEPVDGQMLAELLQMAVILESHLTLTHALANTEYAEGLMVEDLIAEQHDTCADNGVNRCMCAVCSPDPMHDPDEPIPFWMGAE